jgi:hypothetical protein
MVLTTPTFPIDKHPPHRLGPPIDAGGTADLPAIIGVSGEVNQPAVEAFNTGGGVGVLAEGDHPQGVGIHARGGHLAGRFEGNVEITGHLIGPSIDLLAQRIADLEALRMTRFGIPINPLVARPVIDVRTSSIREGDAEFAITGSGFAAGSKIVLRVVNVTNNTVISSPGLSSENGDIDLAFTVTPFLSSNSGTLSLNAFLTCHAGDTLTFCATDRRPDLIDTTELLWSNQVQLVVS